MSGEIPEKSDCQHRFNGWGNHCNDRILTVEGVVGRCSDRVLTVEGWFGRGRRLSAARYKLTYF
jgi:hypothetical protein